MVYTLTLNPSLDYYASVRNFELGKTNRTEEERMIPGGKGINAAIILDTLGMDVTALGFTAGFVGEQIETLLYTRGLKQKFIRLDNGCSRINVKLPGYDGTEINGMGPSAAENNVEQLKQEFRKLRQDDCVILAGSLLKGMQPDFYTTLAADLHERNVLFIVDTTGEQLLKVLPYQPFLIKPNRQELEELFGEKAASPEQVFEYARRLKEMGAENVLVSLGGNGAVLLDADGEKHRLPAFGGKPVNSVGAGDSMVAAFLAGWLQTHSFEKAFRLGTAAGSATACTQDLASKEQIMAMLSLIEESQPVSV